jgi:hypothetical protein
MDFKNYEESKCNRKLLGMEPGLVKIVFPYNKDIEEEIALILSPFLADCVCLINNAVPYEYFLRESMKAATPFKGLKIIGPFSGHKFIDRCIEEVNDRTIKLNTDFYNFENNFDSLLIPCNSPSFKEVINEMKKALCNYGFDVDNSRWDDYKIWKAEKLKAF